MKPHPILTLAPFLSLCITGPAFGQSPPSTISLPPVCGVTLRPPSVSPETFADVEGGLRQKSYAVIQRASDIFSWQDFIALNWPASAERGQPAKSEPLHAGGMRVWETWPAPSEVFLKTGAAPAWGTRFKGKGTQPLKVLHDTREPTVSDGVLPPSLKDQRGEPVYFEIRLNKVFFDYIVANKLYDAKSQNELGKIEAPTGSILVKAAWRVLGPEENDFYSTEALVPANPVSGSSGQRRAKVGLVGFHIMHKTRSAPQWIWSTFEHVRNVQGAHASFHNDRCVNGAVNVQTPDGVPNQVTREVPIPSVDPSCENDDESIDNLAALNKTVRTALKPSVFEHYEQIGTQWPVHASSREESPTAFEVRPALLGNTVLETFIQSTSSCMGCHAMARTVQAGSFVSSDFTFTLAQASPAQKDPNVIDPPQSPANTAEADIWSSILRGYQIASSTYETLPDYLPDSKLHCQSCHLNAGANRHASWWVGMSARDKYPTRQKLVNRINQCFTKSMNGRPLCADDEEHNPDMNALLDYMHWLDGRAKATKICLPTSPFPDCPKPETVESKRGGEIYLQKCAFCHGADGQGRYESGTYYRPALWGPHSFNQQAGLFKTPQMLPSFLKGNMPFGSGGELTHQEAWDLAAFINDLKLHPRPAGSQAAPK
ncbi:MAG: c-type cytochrome [Verrucomicrobiaceae bacterium]|nr:c-type cytochrome [Verrucomicrobiaceae bacterium]